MVYTNYLYLFIVIWGMVCYCFTHTKFDFAHCPTQSILWKDLYRHVTPLEKMTMTIHLGCLPNGSMVNEHWLSGEL